MQCEMKNFAGILNQKSYKLYVIFLKRYRRLTRKKELLSRKSYKFKYKIEGLCLSTKFIVFPKVY